MPQETGKKALESSRRDESIAVGVNGLFLETHPSPSQSPSDGPNMVPLDQMPALLNRVVRIREAVEALPLD